MSAARGSAGRLVLVTAALSLGVPSTGAAAQAAAAASPASSAYATELDSLWEAILRDYAYWEESAADWGRARTLLRPRAQSASTPEQAAQVIADLLATLGDPAARVVPEPRRRGVADTRDIWAEWQDGRIVITDVREGSAADEADVEPGMEVVAVNGQPIQELLTRTAPGAMSRPDAGAMEATLRALLADPPGEGRTLEVRTPRRKEATLRMDDSPPPAYPPRPAVVWETLPEGFGYVAIRELDSLDIVSQFDAAMDRLANAPGLLIDLRELPDGGSSAVVRGLLGRFVEAETGYARGLVPGGKLWPNLDRRFIDLVEPRGSAPYTRPVVVLVGRWTAGEAEDIALGLDGLGRATVVGRPMAGLHGETRLLALPRSNVRVELPVVRRLHLDGTPREEFEPELLVDVTSESARGQDDPVHRAGVEALRRLTGGE